MREAKIIGQKIKLLRIQKEITQQKLAKLLECSQPELSAWETGKTLIPMKYFIKLPKILGVTMDYFDPEKDVFCEL